MCIAFVVERQRSQTCELPQRVQTADIGWKREVTDQGAVGWADLMGEFEEGRHPMEVKVVILVKQEATFQVEGNADSEDLGRKGLVGIGAQKMRSGKEVG